MKKDEVTAEIIVKENKVGILRVGNVNYISLTDLAKYQNSSDPSFSKELVKKDYNYWLHWLMGRNPQSWF